MSDGARVDVPDWLRALGNCDFAGLRRTCGGQETGVARALVVSLLAVEGRTG